MRKEVLKQEKTPERIPTKWEFTVVKYLFVFLFLALIAHFVNFMLKDSEEFINNDYNGREELFAETVTRGEIHSSDGKILAMTLVKDGEETRYYPYENIFSHVIGYSIYGKAGVEKMANFNLLRSHVSIEEKVENELSGLKYIGDNVITTLDYELQNIAYDTLSYYDGAIVILEPSTGRILAMVSKPDYNPNEIKEDWEFLISEKNTSAALLNRATQGLYPPGSTFKIITTLAYLRQNKDETQYEYVCNGKHTAEDALIHCIYNKKHGTINLEESFAESCNSSFANIGLSLDCSEFHSLCDSLLFNTELPTKFPYSKSSFTLSDESSQSDIIQAAIGQGTTLVTPFHMALITSAIANDGTLMTPYVIERVENHLGEVVAEYSPSKYGKLISDEENAVLQAYMEAVVDYGTGKKLQSDVYKAAGKSGSADFSSDADASCHSWFVGYASGEGKEDIAVAILVEEAGTGGTVAVPMAKEIFDAYFAE